MSNILAYPAIPEVSEADLLIISDISEDGNPTRTVSVQALVGGSTAPLGLTVNGTSGAATLIDNILNIPIYTGGGGGTVTNVTYSTNINAFAASVTNSSSSPDITLTLNGGSAGQFLQQDGEWATVPSGGGTMSQWNVDDGGAGGFQVANNNTVTVNGSTKILVSTNVAAKSITTTHKDTARTDTTSTASPAAGATFTVVDSITQDATGHPTAVNVKTVTMPAGGGGGSVNSVDETTPGTSIGTPIVVDPTTGSVLVKSMAYDGTTNVGHVPTGGSATTFLRGDGTWVVPSGGGAGTTYDLASAQDGNNVDITLTPSTGAVDTVQLTAGTGITLADDGNNNITIISAASGTGLWTATGNDIYNNNSGAVVVGRTSLNDPGAILQIEGRVSLKDTTTNGVFIGTGAGKSTTGTNNVALGSQALMNNIVGRQNTAIGTNTLLNAVEDSNTAVGYSAGSQITTGEFNTAIGARTLLAQTTGDSNTAIGSSALSSLVTGTANIAIGKNCMYLATGGDYNIAVGENSLRDNTTGDANTVIGYSSISENTTGNFNTALGYLSLDHNITGASNLALGYLAGRSIKNSGGNNSNANNSTYIGARTDAGAANVTEEIVIGYEVEGNGSNTTTIGDMASTQATYLGGDLILQSASLHRGVYAVGALPTGVMGARAYVANGPSNAAYRDVVSSGSTGSEVLPVFYNGTNWIYA